MRQIPKCKSLASRSTLRKPGSHLRVILKNLQNIPRCIEIMLWSWSPRCNLKREGKKSRIDGLANDQTFSPFIEAILLLSILPVQSDDPPPSHHKKTWLCATHMKPIETPPCQYWHHSTPDTKQILSKTPQNSQASNRQENLAPP